MKILIFSPSYLPKIGGLENTVDALANEYVKAGHRVKLVTLTPADQEISRPFQIIRKPNAVNLLKSFYWCDVVHQPNVSLKGLWPFLFFKRRYFVSHHTTNYAIDGSITILGKLKYFVSRFAHNAACSSYVNSLLPKKGLVINSPYNQDQFKILNSDSREKDLVFVGRLVSDKGCDLILQAVSILKAKGVVVSLSIVGSGPEFSNLKALARDLHVDKQVYFKGAVVGTCLTSLLNAHKVLVAPSIWNEPFGKVALEGLACGCKVIVPDSGGFPEAAGPTGILFEKGNATNLAEKIEAAIKGSTSRYKSELNLVEKHLDEHTMSAIGEKYINWIQLYAERYQDK